MPPSPTLWTAPLVRSALKATGALQPPHRLPPVLPTTTTPTLEPMISTSAYPVLRELVAHLLVPCIRPPTVVPPETSATAVLSLLAMLASTVLQEPSPCLDVIQEPIRLTPGKSPVTSAQRAHIVKCKLPRELSLLKLALKVSTVPMAPPTTDSSLAHWVLLEQHPVLLMPTGVLLARRLIIALKQV